MLSVKAPVTPAQASAQAADPISTDRRSIRRTVRQHGPCQPNQDLAADLIPAAPATIWRGRRAAALAAGIWPDLPVALAAAHTVVVVAVADSVDDAERSIHRANDQTSCASREY